MGKIKLGDEVTDKVTGYTGIAIARTEWVYGCVRFGVQSQHLHEGKPIDAVWFDEAELTANPVESKGGPPRNGVETG